MTDEELISDMEDTYCAKHFKLENDVIDRLKAYMELVKAVDIDLDNLNAFGAISRITAFKDQS